MTSITRLNLYSDSMQSMIPEEALDTDKCRQAMVMALSQPEPEKAFDRDEWLTKTKAQLTRQ